MSNDLCKLARKNILFIYLEKGRDYVSYINLF